MDNQSSIVSSPSSARSPSTTHPIAVLAQLTPLEYPVVSDPVVVSFEEYINDQSKVKPADKNRFILCASYGVVPDFTLEVEPYTSMKKSQHPTQMMYKQEIIRRDSTVKIRKRKNDELIILLKDIGYKVSDQDRIFIIDNERAIRQLLGGEEKEIDMEEEEQTDRVVHKISNLKKRLLSLEEKISESKKRCAKLDDNKTN